MVQSRLPGTYDSSDESIPKEEVWPSPSPFSLLTGASLGRRLKISHEPPHSGGGGHDPSSSTDPTVDER